MSSSPPNLSAPTPARMSRSIRFWGSRSSSLAPAPSPSSGLSPSLLPGTSVRESQPKSKIDWLEPLLLAAKAVTAATEAVPTPIVKAVFGTIVVVLEIVQKTKKNREDLRGLCQTIVDVMNIIQGHVDSRQASDSSKLEALCADLESVLKALLSTVEKLLNKPKGLRGRLTEALQSDTLGDEISGHKERIQELRLNFILITNLDTNRQVHRHGASARLEAVPEETVINNCPPASRIFQGRQAILEKVQKFFRQEIETQHIYVLYGLGGVGKTQIALKSIDLLHSCFMDIFFIDASSGESIALHFQQIATSKKIGTSIEDAKEWLVGKRQPWLLFFDNADDPKLDLNKHLPKCNHGNIIITSRNPELRTYATAHGSYTQVTDMEEEEAIDLLLKRAAQDDTPEARAIAGDIVKTLHLLPLAIIQAGAFIAKSRNLVGYLSLYKQNQAQLLSEKPNQSSDDYAWTVYTTWKISFDKLGSLAQQLLQLCSLLHFDGISEFIFKTALNYDFPSWGPPQEELQKSLEFLSNFRTTNASWDSLKFAEITNELSSYSLLNFDPVRQVFSMHPLVHEWCWNAIADQVIYFPCMIGIMGMCIQSIPTEDMHIASVHLKADVDTLMGKGQEIIPDFKASFARVYFWTRNHEVGKQLELAVLEKHRALFGDAHPETLRAMEYLAGTLNRLGSYQEAKKLNEQVLEKRQAMLGDDHLDTFSAISNLAASHHQMGAYKEAKQLYEEVLEKRQALLGDTHLDTLHTMASLANMHSRLGAYQKAKKLNEQVLEKRCALLGESHPHTLTAMANLAATNSRLGAYLDAKKLNEQVLGNRQALLGDTHLDTLHAKANLAATLHQLGAYEEAKQLDEEVLENRRTLLGDMHPDTLRSMSHVAAMYSRLGAYQEAKKLNEQVLETRYALLGDSHPDTLNAMANMAATHSQLGAYKEAKEINEQVLEKRQALLGDTHPDTLSAMANLAATLGHLGAYEEAKQLNEEVLEKRKSLLGVNHPHTLRAMANLAATHQKLGAYYRAKHLEEQVLQQRRALLGDAHPETLTAMACLAVTHHQLGLYQEAESLEVKVLNQRRDLLGDAHPDTLFAMANLALTLSQLSQFQEAKELEETVLHHQRKVLGVHHPDTLQTMSNLAATFRKLRQIEEAESLERELEQSKETM